MSVEIISEKFRLKVIQRKYTFPRWALNVDNCAEIYEKCDFQWFRLLSIEIIEDFFRQKVIHSQLNHWSLNWSTAKPKVLKNS